MRKRQLGQGCAEWFFQRVATEELVFFNGAIQADPCQGTPAFEEAEADALATSPRPGPARKYPTQLQHKCAHTQIKLYKLDKYSIRGE